MSPPWCHAGVALGTDFESPERCAAAAADRCVGSSRIQWHKSGDGRCGCCTADDAREYDVDEWDVYEHGPAWNSTAGLGGPDQTSEFSSSIKSKSIRLIFGRIDCSRRVLEAQPKSLRQHIRIRAH
jgi:hypothetical protein